MSMKDEIKKTSIDLIASNIRKTLAEDGYVLSKTNPFFDWIRGAKTNACHPRDHGLSFHIANPPVPPISPFDCATAFIDFESANTSGIYFQLTFYIHNALVPYMESEEIHKIYEKHDHLWFPKLSTHFTDIEDSFHLSWETEYDESIEDSLYGRFSIEASGNISAIMKTLKINPQEVKYNVYYI